MHRVKITTSKEEYAEKLKAMRQTSDGAEVLDSTPMQPPIGYKRQPSMVDHIRNLIRSEKLAMEAESAGKETFEEADDFHIEDDIFPASAYEFDEHFEPPVKVVPKDMPAPEHAEGDRQGPKPKEPPEAAGLDDPAPKRAKTARRAPKEDPGEDSA